MVIFQIVNEPQHRASFTIWKSIICRFFAHFARFSRIYYLKSDHWPLSTLDLREKATFCAVFAHLLFENRPLVAFQIGNCAVPRCLQIFSMSSPEKSENFMKNMKKRQESRPRRLIFLKFLKNRPTWSRFLLFPHSFTIFSMPSLQKSRKIAENSKSILDSLLFRNFYKNHELWISICPLFLTIFSMSSPKKWLKSRTTPKSYPYRAEKR